jgi:hypothetical protein
MSGLSRHNRRCRLHQLSSGEPDTVVLFMSNTCSETIRVICTIHTVIGNPCCAAGARLPTRQLAHKMGDQRWYNVYLHFE